jgi:hypothetical protein
MKLLAEEEEDPKPEQPTTDKAEPSAKGEKRKKKKSKSEKKKRPEKKLKEKVNEEAHLVTSEAKQQSNAAESKQPLPEDDQHSEAKASTDMPEPSQEVVQVVNGEEKEIKKDDADEGSGEFVAEEDLLNDEVPNDEEKVSEEKKDNEEGPDGQGQNNAGKTTTDTPVEQAILKNDDPVPEKGNVAGGSAPGGDQLAATEKVTAGDVSPPKGIILKRKRTTRRKVVPHATADMPVGTDPEPIVSAPVEEERDDEGVSNVVGPKKKKQKVPVTAVRRSNRPRA